MSRSITLTTAQKKRAHPWRHAAQRPKTIEPFKGWGLATFKHTQTYVSIHSAMDNYHLHHHTADFDAWMKQTWASWLERRESFETFSRGFTPLEFALCLYTLIHVDSREPDDILTLLEVVSRDILDAHHHPERIAFFLDGMEELATLREHLAPGNEVHGPLISTAEATTAFFLRRELCWVPEDVYETISERASTLHGTRDEALDIFLALLMPSESAWGDALVDRLLDAVRQADTSSYKSSLPVLALATGASHDRITKLVDSGLLREHTQSSWHWNTLLDMVITHESCSIPWLVTLLHDSEAPSLDTYALTSLAQVIDDEDFVEALLARMLRQSSSTTSTRKLLGRVATFSDLLLARLPGLLAGAKPDQGMYGSLSELLETIQTQHARLRAESESQHEFIDPVTLPEALRKLPWHGKKRQPALPAFWRPLANTPLLLRQNPALKLPRDLYDDIGRIMKASDDPKLTAAREAIGDLFDEVSLSKFCWDLFEDWQTAGSPAKQMWIFDAFTRYGAEELTDHLPGIMDYWIGSKFHKRGIKLLQEIDPGRSAFMCEALEAMMHGSYSRGALRAREALEGFAQEGMDVLDAIDAATPRLGLDETRHVRFDTSSAPLEITLDAELEPHIRDHNAATLDPTTQLRWERLTRRLAHMAGRLATRLERALITQRRWSPELWQAHIGDHPITSCLAERLVWGTFDARGKLLQTWRIDETRAKVDVDDVPVDLSTAKSKAPKIGLVHPLHLTEAQRSGWLAQLADYEIIQPFEQLTRAHITTPPTTAQWKSLYGRTTTHDALHAMFVRHRWHALPLIYMTAKIPGYGLHLELAGKKETALHPFKFHLESGIHKTPEWRDDHFELEKCINLARIPWAEIEPIAYSELWRSMNLTFLTG